MHIVELKLCPFCGGEVMLTFIPSHRHIMPPNIFALGLHAPATATIECAACEVGMIRHGDDATAEVVNAWNHRA